MTTFANKLRPDDPVLAGTAYVENEYTLYTFDSLGNALVTLVYLLMLNDWPVLMDACAAVTTRGALAYFVIFGLVCIVLAQNVVVAFVIESFSVQKLKRELLDESAAMEGSGSSQVVLPTRGIEDWRQLILRSGVDFSAWRVKRKVFVD